MILMDTHVWFWSLSEPEYLSKTALNIIKRTKPDQRAIASISVWEFAMMVARKRIELKNHCRTLPNNGWTMPSIKPVYTFSS